MGDQKSSPSVDEMFGAARRAEGARRAQLVEEPVVRSTTTVDGEQVDPPRSLGEPLARGSEDGEARLYLEGRTVVAGDVMEVYTHRTTGWLRGRLRWSGQAGDPPQLAVNLFNPNGQTDADGTPPRVGEMVSRLPDGAICRWPAG